MASDGISDDNGEKGNIIAYIATAFSNCLGCWSGILFVVVLVELRKQIL